MKQVALFGLLAAALAVAAVDAYPQHTERSIKYNSWAVLVAGSSGYSNYRHQSDVCHAYQVLHHLGIPDDHIIVMMEDDIAYNANNKYPGKIMNVAYGPNVYEGVPHDYTHEQVTKANFLSIITGQEMSVGSKKTLKSGPDDNVFIFYDDHGNTDLLAFPHGSSLHSKEFGDAIKNMSDRKMFKNLVIYIEACYSGSMFYKLNLPEHVYVTTAAPVGASSFGGSYNDVYAYAWINDLEKDHQSSYSFDDQFNNAISKSLKGYSQGCQYGDENVKNLPIEEFFGPSLGIKRDAYPPLSNDDIIPTLDIELVLAQRQYENNRTEANKKELEREIAIRKAVDDMGIAIVAAGVPGVNYLATVPCTTCSSSCKCYSSCLNEETSTYCEYQCCNEESCYNDPKTRDADLERRETCVLTLSEAFTNACGREHPYLLSLELQFRRMCRQLDVNVTSALDTIRSECSTFDLKNF